MTDKCTICECNEYGNCPCYFNPDDELCDFSFQIIDMHEHDAKVRADAIDEFAKAYKKVETHGCIVCKHLDDGIKCWECISEQLKEKKE